MELLFYYCKDKKYIDEKGIQLGGKYDFDFNVASNKILYKENHGYKPKFYSEGSSVTNITAIVGENGSGKTSLLRAIFENSLPGVIMIFLEDDNSIIVSNDYGEVIIEYIGNEEPPEIREDRRYLLRQEPEKQHIIRNVHKTISYVYLSNSIYLQNEYGYSKDASISKVMLTPGAVNEISKQFYKNINSVRDNNRECHENDDYVNVLWNREIESFHQLCVMEYYCFLLRNNIKDNYLVKTLQDIQIQAIFPIINSQVLIDNDLDGNSFGRIWDSYYRVCSIMEKENLGLINILLCDLMLEMCDLLERECNDDLNLADIADLSKECHDLLGILEEKKNHKFRLAKEYYRFAFESINQLYDILGNSIEITKDNKATVSWSNETKYRKFVQLIHKCLFKEEYAGTFLITHLIFEQNALSSGEQAMQNFFSWIHALDWFHKIDQYTIDGLKDNVILLIDEIDLYAHPEWQRQIICRLLENVANQFHRKKVQIVFSTHSPLVLSDMLSNNTIYLQGGRAVIPKEMKENFGNELYSILNHSFFLQNGVIGEFARQKIQNIIDILEDTSKTRRLDKSSLRRIEQDIEVIGNTLIKIKLYEMIDKYRMFNDKKEMDIDLEIRMLERRIQYLEEQKK